MRLKITVLLSFVFSSFISTSAFADQITDQNMATLVEALPVGFYSGMTISLPHQPCEVTVAFDSTAGIYSAEINPPQKTTNVLPSRFEISVGKPFHFFYVKDKFITTSSDVLQHPDVAEVFSVVFDSTKSNYRVSYSAKSKTDALEAACIFRAR